MQICLCILVYLRYNSVRRGDVPSLAWSQIKDIRVSIPVTEDGEFDLKKQEEIVRKFELIEARKVELAEKIELTCEKLEEDYLHFQEDRIQNSEAEMDYVSRKILEKGKGAK